MQFDVGFVTSYFQADVKAHRCKSLPLNTRGFLSTTHFKFCSKGLFFTQHLGAHAEKDDNPFSSADSDPG